MSGIFRVRAITPYLIPVLIIAALAVLTQVRAGGAASDADGSEGNAVLLSLGQPADLGGYEHIIEPLRQVDSVTALEAALDSSAKLIVIDRSAVHLLQDSDVLYRQLKLGRSLLGLNISPSDLRALSEFDRAVAENRLQLNQATELQPAEPAPDSPYYVFLRISPEGSEIRRFGWTANSFTERLFEPAFRQHAAGAYENLPTTVD